MPKKKDAGEWTAEEDETIRDEAAKDTSVASKMVSLMKLLPHRSRDGIRKRYMDLDFGKKWTEKEDGVLLANMPTPWTPDRIAELLPGRTIDSIRTRIDRSQELTEARQAAGVTVPRKKKTPSPHEEAEARKAAEAKEAVLRQLAELPRQDAAQAKLDEEAAAAAMVQRCRSRIASQDSAVTLALIQEMAVWPELGCLVAELYAELCARLKSDSEQKGPETLLRALLAPREPLPAARERFFPATVQKDAPFRRWLLGGKARTEAEALLKERAAAARVRTALQMQLAAAPSSGQPPPSKCQTMLDRTFKNPQNWAGWHPLLKQWAMRFGLHLRWLELEALPGGPLLRAQNMLTVLMCILVLRVPRADRPEVAYPANCEVYGQQVPQQGIDIRECLVRGWHWWVDGELVWLGCLESARQLCYLLHRFGIHLPHNPPKANDLDLPPFNFFLHPDVFLAVQQPTETLIKLELLLVRRVVKSKRAAQKYADASLPGASPTALAAFRNETVQLEAMQRWPNEVLLHVADPAKHEAYTPASDTCIWAAVLSIPNSSASSLPFPEANVLRDAGSAAVCDRLWAAQCPPRRLAAEPQGRMGDPASFRHHSEGNGLTKHAGANLVCLTTYSVTRPDPRAPEGYTRPTDQSVGTTLLLQGGDGGGGDDGGGGGDGQRALPVATPEAAVEPCDGSGGDGSCGAAVDPRPEAAVQPGDGSGDDASCDAAVDPRSKRQRFTSASLTAAPLTAATFASTVASAPLATPAISTSAFTTAPLAAAPIAATALTTSVTAAALAASTVAATA